MLNSQNVEFIQKCQIHEKKITRVHDQTGIVNSCLARNTDIGKYYQMHEWYTINIGGIGLKLGGDIRNSKSALLYIFQFVPLSFSLYSTNEVSVSIESVGRSKNYLIQCTILPLFL